MDNIYRKIIDLKGSYFERETEKKKKNKSQLRYIREETVAKFFKDGNCSVLVIIQASGREVLLNKDSSKEEILRYLGEKFLD